MNRQVEGREWEGEARRRLEAAGLELLDRNFRCRLGELDLIFLDGDTLVFVEVRFRRRSYFGSGAESVSARKRGRLIAAAQHYLQRHAQHADRPCRFDVVSISGGVTPQLEWIRNAFTLDDA